MFFRARNRCVPNRANAPVGNGHGGSETGPAFTVETGGTGIGVASAEAGIAANMLPKNVRRVVATVPPQRMRPV
jgi:hypothetical protein